MGAVGRHAKVQPFIQERPGLLQPALQDGQGAQRHPGSGDEPGVAESLC